MSINKLLENLKKDDLMFDENNFKILINDSIFNCQKSRPKIVRSEFGVSNIFDSERVLYFYMLGQESEPNNAIILRKFDAGNDMHERYYRYFSNASILVDKEIVIKKTEPPISGRMDAILNIKGSMFVGELKSINNNGFREIVKNGGKLEHMLQLQIYMDITGINHGLLIYENKDNQEFISIHQTINQDQIRDTYKKLYSVLEYLKERKPPPRCFLCNAVRPSSVCGYLKVCNEIEGI